MNLSTDIFCLQYKHQWSHLFGKMLCQGNANDPLNSRRGGGKPLIPNILANAKAGKAANISGNAIKVITDSSKYCPEFAERLVVSPRDAGKYAGDPTIVAAFCTRSMAKKLLSLDFPNLKFIQLFSAGYDGIDLDICKRKGITLCNAVDIYNYSMAEFIVYAMLRRAKRYHRNIKNMWLRPLRNYHYITELKGKTVGIMGCGNIGLRVAKLLSGFDMNIIGYSAHTNDRLHFQRVYGASEKNEFVNQCDYIVNTVPLMPSTTGLLDNSWFSQMKDDVTFINVARKETINDKDFIKFLKSHRDAIAILDMFEIAPNPITNPYRRIRNVLVLPSVTAGSAETMPRLHRLLLKILDHLKNNTNPADSTNVIVNP